MARAAVVGCGIIGLTTALRLQEEGFQVSIFARELPPGTTSNKAAAIWEPFKIEPQEKVIRWAALSYRRYLGDVSEPRSGVSMVDLVLTQREADIDQPFWLRPEYSSRYLKSHELPAGYLSGLAIQVPFIPSRQYLDYLRERFLQGKGILVQRNLQSLDEIFEGCDVVVNCSGLGARELASDLEVRPIRGQLAIVSLARPVPFLVDDTSYSEPLYFFPRGRECVLGGTVEWDCWETTEDITTRERILERCRKVAPELRESRFLRGEVGLRPGRCEVRLQRDESISRPVLVHNYGHGGAGFTTAWGCAEEVVRLLD